jgi:very-short-patch-repair endonuclease
MWSWLRNGRLQEYKFRRQHPIGPYLLDFFCNEAMLDVEVDGSQHGLPKNQAEDKTRDAYLEARGIKVLRFWNAHLRRDKLAIRGTIWRTLQERAPHPLPDYCSPKPPVVGENQDRGWATRSPSP